VRTFLIPEAIREALDSFSQLCLPSHALVFSFTQPVGTSLLHITQYPTPHRLSNGPLSVMLLLRIVLPTAHPTPPASVNTGDAHRCM